MTEHSKEEMKAACHSTAEWVLRRPCTGNRCKWLQKQVAAFLSNPEAIEAYAKSYAQEYPYADVRSSFLAQALKSYDEELI